MEFDIWYGAKEFLVFIHWYIFKTITVFNTLNCIIFAAFYAE
jgi:hypothetical protein